MRQVVLSINLNIVRFLCMYNNRFIGLDTATTVHPGDLYQWPPKPNEGNRQW